VLAGLFHFLLQLQQKNAFEGFFFKQLGQWAFNSLSLSPSLASDALQVGHISAFINAYSKFLAKPSSISLFSDLLNIATFLHN
jgi:hypothetical protein